MHRPPQRHGPRGPRPPAAAQRYANATMELAVRARAWIERHPQAAPALEWRYPSDVMVLADAHAAIEKGFVSCNADGRMLLTAMLRTLPAVDAPSIQMVRMGFELALSADCPRGRCPASPCPSCGTVLEGLTGITRQGDSATGGLDFGEGIYVCICCAAINATDEDGWLIPADATRLAAADAGTHGIIEDVRASVLKLIARRPNKPQ